MVELFANSGNPDENTRFAIEGHLDPHYILKLYQNPGSNNLMAENEKWGGILIYLA